MSFAKLKREGIIIIGSGPTGLAAALFLARMGVKPRILEGSSRRIPKTRAVGIHSRTVEILSAAGLGRSLLNEGHRVGRIHIYADDKPLMEHRLDYANSEFPFIIDLPQSTLEAMLESELARHDVQVEYGMRVREVENGGEDGALRVTVDSPDRTRLELPADLLLACDGWRSRGRVFVSPDGSQLPERHFLLADVRLNGELSTHAWHVHCGAHGGVFMFPLGDDLWRCVIELQGSDAEAPAGSLNELVVSRLPGDTTLLDIQKSKVVSLVPFLANRFHRNRAFLLGDAAHVFPFNGNQGLNQGVQDAHNLAWKIRLLTEDVVGLNYLASYDDERRRHARRMWNFSRGLERLTHWHAPGSRRVREMVFASLHAFHSTAEKFVNRLESTEIEYAESTPMRGGVPTASLANIFRPSPGPSAGSLVPDARLIAQIEGEPVRIRELGQTGMFLLLLVVRGTIDDRERQFCRDCLGWSQLPDWIERWIVAGRRLPAGLTAPPSEHLVDPREVAHDRFGVEQVGIFLVRPDNILVHAYRPGRRTRFEPFGRWSQRLREWEHALVPV